MSSFIFHRVFFQDFILSHTLYTIACIGHSLILARKVRCFRTSWHEMKHEQELILSTLTWIYFFSSLKFSFCKVIAYKDYLSPQDGLRKLETNSELNSRCIVGANRQNIDRTVYQNGSIANDSRIHSQYFKLKSFPSYRTDKEKHSRFLHLLALIFYSATAKRESTTNQKQRYRVRITHRRET